jgi:hypothetical protein
MFRAKIVSQAVLASAVAGLFLAGGASSALADSHESEAKVKCEGVNECKGHGACKTAKNACAGKNGCDGQGYLMMTKAECDAAKAKKAEKE